MDLCAVNGRSQPGIRFHPTNVELVMYYLKRKVMRKGFRQDMVNEVDVYKFHPKDLRDLASMKKDLNWYFFCSRGKKYGSGERTNRATESGYWKATGNDRVVSYQDRTVGKIKTLVFHEGKPPKGTRTDWVMHEYKLEDQKLADAGVCQDSYVLCKVFEKSGWGPKNAEQYGAPFIEEEWEDEDEVLTVCDPTTSVVFNVVESLIEYYPAADPSTSAVSNVVESLIEYYPAATAATSEQYGAPLIEEEWEDEDGVLTVGDVSNAVESLSEYYPAATAAASEQVVSLSTDDEVLTVGDPSTSCVCNPVESLSEYYPAATAATSEQAVSDDEMNRMLEMFVVGDESKVFEGLEDLDNTNFNGNEWTNFDNGGFYLSELDELLIPGQYLGS